MSVVLVYDYLGDRYRRDCPNEAAARALAVLLWRDDNGYPIQIEEGGRPIVGRDEIRGYVLREAEGEP